MNVEDSKGNASMLARLLGLIIHPFIRLGYGLEFGIPSLVAQSRPRLKLLICVTTS